MATKKTKKKGKKRAPVVINIGDTVKLTKGRIGLVRFKGQTQFGLGEWIGIELYNELTKTRHNGAVLGKRYFRCPRNRGVFVRKKLIRLNIAVLDIEPSIKQMRKKEKKIKIQRKKQIKKEKEARKTERAKKKQLKQQRINMKYDNTNSNNDNAQNADNTISIDLSPTQTSPTDDTSNKKKKLDKMISEPEDVGQNERDIIQMFEDHDELDGNDNNDNVSIKIMSSSIMSVMPMLDEVTEEVEVTRPRQDSDGPLSHFKRKSENTKLQEELEIEQSQNSLTLLFAKQRSMKAIQQIIPKKSNENDVKTKDEIDVKIDKNASNIATETMEKAGILRRVKTPVNLDDDDGVIESDDSLNDEDDDDDDEVEKKLMEKEFEENYPKFDAIIDEYNHSIDDFETARKKLANKLVLSKKREIREKYQKQYTNQTILSPRTSSERNINQLKCDSLKARSRRGSRFVDDRSFGDVFFFDGEEDTNDVNEVEKFYDDDPLSPLGDIQDEMEDELDPVLTAEYEDDLDDDWRIDDDDDELPRKRGYDGGGGGDDDDDDDGGGVQKIAMSDIEDVDVENDDQDSLNESDDDRGDGGDGGDGDDEEEVKIMAILKDRREEKKLVLYASLSEYLEWSPNEDGFGMKITKISKSVYGKEMYIETGIENDWQIIEINGENISKMMKLYIQSVLKKVDINKGYNILFKKPPKQETNNNDKTLKPSVYKKKIKK